MTSRTLPKRAIDHRSLPSPRHYLASRGLLRERPRGAWTAIACPVHKAGNESHPSLRIHLTHGRFRCMACGASGGDILALHRLITRQGFAEALKDLGGRFYV
jgi:hypothetical protein